MSRIHEVATITSKGQITLPKPIRQALGVDSGGKVAFDFNPGESLFLVHGFDPLSTLPRESVQERRKSFTNYIHRLLGRIPKKG